MQKPAFLTSGAAREAAAESGYAGHAPSGLLQARSWMRRCASRSLRMGLAIFAAAAFSLLPAAAAFASIPIRDSGVAVTAEQVAAVEANYNKINGSIRQEFESHGNVIYFFDTQPIVNGDSVAYVLGVYMGSEGVDSSITLTNQDYGGAEAICHEMGHYFDDVIYKDEDSEIVDLNFRGITFRYLTGGNRLRSDEYDFGFIWLMEAWDNRCVTEYEKSDRNEYFAGSFQAYCLEPQKLAATAPMTYDFIDDLVKEFVASHPAQGEYADSPWTSVGLSESASASPGESAAEPVLGGPGTSGNGRHGRAGSAAWIGDEYGWWLQLPDGGHLSNEWAVVDGAWYYFDGSGYRLTGWQQVNGRWYYFKEDGRMATGWLTRDGKWYYMDADGYLLTGWHEIKGQWYYLDRNTGELWVNARTPDGHYVNQEGVMVE